MESILHRSPPPEDGASTTKYEQGQMQDREQGSEPSSKPANSSFLSNMNKYWIWEILSCLGSLIALVSIIGVLINYDGKPTPNWPYGVTINTALSFIIQVFSGFMLGTVAACLSQNAWIHFSTGDRPLSSLNSYHWASRGIWGSLTFLWEARPRIRPLSAQREFTTMASLGCLITILAIGVGPFVQQMSTIRNVRMPVNEPASVGRGQIYMEKTNFWSSSIQIPASLLAALYSNLFQGFQNTNQQNGSSTVSSSSIPVNCPSGECDFPIFRSLAVCSACHDLSNMLDTRCDKGTYCLPEGKSRCNHTLPNGLQAILSDIDSYGFPYHRTNNTPLTPEMRKQAQVPEYGYGRIFDISQIKIPSDRNVSHATASYCALYWCVNTYSSAVRKNKLEETVLDSWYDPNVHSGFSLNGSVFYLRPPQKDNLPQNPFIFGDVASSMIKWWFRGKLIMSNLPNVDVCGGMGSGKGWSDSSEFEDPLLRQSMTDIFKGFADSITTRVRKWDWDSQTTFDIPSLAGIGAANGTSFEMETQIHVKWAWIALPCSLLVLTMFFMGMTAWNTKRMGLEAWKSSPTALVCSGLDENVQQEIRTLKDPVGMENATAGVPVRLGRHNDGYGNYWKLERVNRS